MRSRAQWEPLCADDPVPGDADEVELAGTHYSEMADEIEGQVRRLKNIANSTVDGTLQGKYVESLATSAEGLQDELDKASGRYREVGGALQHWGPQLREFQNEAEWLRKQALAAQSDMSDNQAIERFSAVDAPPPADEQVAADNARAGRYDDANNDLRRAQNKLTDLTGRRDQAAANIADAIRDKCDQEADSLWDNLQDQMDVWAKNFDDWMDHNHELVTKVCTVLGVIALVALVVCLVIPGLNILAGGVLAAGAAETFVAATGTVAAYATVTAVSATTLSMAAHTALYATHNGPWSDIALDAVGLAGFGTGRFLSTGFKALRSFKFNGALEQLTAETKIAGAEARATAARVPIETQVDADIAQARQRLLEPSNNPLRRWAHEKAPDLVEGTSRKIRLAVGEKVATIGAQGVTDSQNAFNATKTAYMDREVTTNFFERLAKGGGDSELAAMRAQVQDAAAGFAPTSKVGLAAAKATKAYWTALAPTATGNGATAFSVGADQYKLQAYEDLKDRTWTREGGDLWAR